MTFSTPDLKDLLRLALAPMAGISSPVFRLLCREQGATVAFTEMISAKGLLLGNPRTRAFLNRLPGEGPAGAQLFGPHPGEIAEAALHVEEAGFALVDVNMGCPVRKVVGMGAGAALLRDVPRAARVVAEIRKRVRIPVTAKIRAGWSPAERNAVEVARALEDAGVHAVILHPRTRDQGYGGRADWDLIGEVKAALSVPVVGNGDVTDAAAAVRMRDLTGCDGVMIGRAALGCPWIFREAAAALAGAPLPPPPTPRERYALFLRHLRGLRAESGPHRAVARMRRMAAWYLRGQRGAAAARAALNQAERTRDLLAVVKGILRP